MFCFYSIYSSIFLPNKSVWGVPTCCFLTRGLISKRWAWKNFKILQPNFYNPSNLLFFIKCNYYYYYFFCHLLIFSLSARLIHAKKSHCLFGMIRKHVCIKHRSQNKRQANTHSSEPFLHWESMSLHFIFYFLNRRSAHLRLWVTISLALASEPCGAQRLTTPKVKSSAQFVLTMTYSCVKINTKNESTLRNYC